MKTFILVMAKILPKSKKEEIFFLSYEASKCSLTIKLKITQAPEKGLANEAIIKFLSNLWKIKKSDIELIKGHTKKNKVFLIEKPSANLIKFIENEGSF